MRGRRGYCDGSGDCCRDSNCWTTAEEIGELGLPRSDFYLSERYLTPQGEIRGIFRPKIKDDEGVDYRALEKGETDQNVVRGECIYLTETGRCVIHPDRPVSGKLFFCRMTSIQADEMLAYRNSLGLVGARRLTADENRQMAEPEPVVS